MLRDTLVNSECDKFSFKFKVSKLNKKLVIRTVIDIFTYLHRAIVPI